MHRKDPVYRSRALKAPGVTRNNNVSISSLQLSNPGNMVTLSSIDYRIYNKWFNEIAARIYNSSFKSKSWDPKKSNSKISSISYLEDENWIYPVKFLSLSSNLLILGCAI